MKDFATTAGGTAIISSLVFAGGHPLLTVLGYAVGACIVCVIFGYLRKRSHNHTLDNDKIYQ